MGLIVHIVYLRSCRYNDMRRITGQRTHICHWSTSTLLLTFRVAGCGAANAPPGLMLSQFRQNSFKGSLAESFINVSATRSSSDDLLVLSALVELSLGIAVLFAWSFAPSICVIGGSAARRPPRGLEADVLRSLVSPDCDDGLSSRLR